MGDGKMSHEDVGKLTMAQWLNLSHEGKWPGDREPEFVGDLEGARTYSKWLAEQD
jgi:hypothetical protein